MELKSSHIKDEKALIEQARKGNQNAFRALVTRHEQQIRATILGMIGDEAVCNDIAQEVFIRFYKSLKNFRGDAALSTYLTRIAINLSLNELERRKKKFKRFTSITDQDNLSGIAQKSKARQIENNDLVQKALKELEPDFRSVVVLRLLEGYSLKETSEILQLPSGTVGSRLNRALDKLRKTLKNIHFFI